MAPDLLPLMAEPARAAVRSLGIVARQTQREHIGAFLAALKEIVSAAEVDAGAPPYRRSHMRHQGSFGRDTRCRRSTKLGFDDLRSCRRGIERN